MTRAFVLFLIATILFGCEKPPIREAHREIAGALRDPDSAEFRNSRMFDVDGTIYVCGEVNGKNAFGAMVGFQHFLYMNPLMRVGIDNGASSAIYSCCSALESSGTTGGAQTSRDHDQCMGIAPPLPFSPPR